MFTIFCSAFGFKYGLVIVARGTKIESPYTAGYTGTAPL
jgi:hypothetical protein